MRKININIYFENDVVEKLDEFKNDNSRQYNSRSQVIRQAVDEFLEKKGYPPPRE